MLKNQWIPCLVRTTFLIHWWKGLGSSLGPLTRALIPFIMTLPSGPNNLPKALSQNTITLEISFQYEWGCGGRNIQSIAVGVIHLWLLGLLLNKYSLLFPSHDEQSVLPIPLMLGLALWFDSPNGMLADMTLTGALNVLTQWDFPTWASAIAIRECPGGP